MISYSIISSSSAASSYYTQEATKSNNGEYYKAEESPSQWWGKAVEIAGIKSGEAVELREFVRVLDGKLYNPVKAEQQQLGKVVDGITQHRPGVDFTFSAPKSVSIVGLMGGDIRVHAAHEAAVQRAMAYMEKFAETRVRRDGEVARVNTGNLLYACFSHETSRAQDPQIHTHIVVANATYDRESGQWRSIEPDRLIREMRTADTIYKQELAYELARIGYELRWTKDGPEIREITKEQIDQFSKRRDDIDAQLSGTGKDRETASAGERNTAALETRADKESIPRNILENRWSEEARMVGLDARAIVNSAIKRGDARKSHHRLTVDQCVQRASTHLSEREMAFSHSNLLKASMEFSRGAHQLDKIEDAIKKAESAHEIFGRKDDLGYTNYTTPAGLQAERQAAAMTLAGKRSVPPVMTARDADRVLKKSDEARGFSLNAGQRDAAWSILTNNDRYMVVQGYAGTGKTTMLQTIREAAESEGCKVIGMSAGTKQKNILERDSGIASQTIASFIIKQRKVLLEAETLKNQGGSMTSLGAALARNAETAKSVRVSNILDAARNIRTVAARDRILQPEGKQRVASLAEQLANNAMTWRKASIDDATIVRATFPTKGINNFRKQRATLKQADGSKQLWIIDEASQIGQKDWNTLMELAEKSNARIIWVGDIKQHQSVEAGRALEHHIESGAKIVRLSDIQRQKDEVGKAAVRDFLSEGYSNCRRGDELTILHATKVMTVKDDPALGGSSGQIVGHGAANFEFRPNEKGSYFCTLMNGRGEETTLWGQGIKDAMTDAKVGIGDRVNLQVVGCTPVHLTTKDGKEITVHKNEWVARQVHTAAAQELTSKEAQRYVATVRNERTSTIHTVVFPEGIVASPDEKIKVEQAGRSFMLGSMNDRQVEFVSGPTAAFARLNKIEIADKEQCIQALASYYAKSEHRENTIIVTATNADRHAINSAVRTELKSAGILGEREVSVTSFEKVDLTNTQKREAWSYVPGMTVKAERAYKSEGIQKGETFTVTQVTDKDNVVRTVSDRTGKEFAWNPEVKTNFTAYERKELAMAVNDKVRFTENDRSQGISNGDTGVVTKIGEQSCTIRIGDEKTGRSVEVNTEKAQALTYDYGGTSYGWQGDTQTKTLAFIDGAGGDRDFYVTITRAKEGTTIYTPSVERASQVIARAQEKTSAHERERPTERQTPAEEKVTRDLSGARPGDSIRVEDVKVLREMSVADRSATLLDYGKANYKFEPENKESYFIKYETHNGEVKTAWGSHLEDKIKASSLQAGDRFAFQQTGKSEMHPEIRLVKDGQKMGEKKVADHMKWEIRKVEPGEVKQLARATLVNERTGDKYAVLSSSGKAIRKDDTLMVEKNDVTVGLLTVRSSSSNETIELAGKRPGNVLQKVEAGDSLLVESVRQDGKKPTGAVLENDRTGERHYVTVPKDKAVSPGDTLLVDRVGVISIMATRKEQIEVKVTAAGQVTVKHPESKAENIAVRERGEAKLDVSGRIVQATPGQMAEAPQRFQLGDILKVDSVRQEAGKKPAEVVAVSNERTGEILSISASQNKSFEAGEILSVHRVESTSLTVVRDEPITIHRVTDEVKKADKKEPGQAKAPEKSSVIDEGKRRENARSLVSGELAGRDIAERRIVMGRGR